MNLIISGIHHLLKKIPGIPGKPQCFFPARTNPAHSPGDLSMKPFALLTGIALLLVLATTGIVSADQNTTAPVTTATTASTVTTTVTTTETAERTGGSVFFETFPAGATIWLDTVNIGTSPFTYFTEKTGVREVRIWKKGYLNYTGTVTITEGKMERFYARLTDAPRVTYTEIPPATTVTTATTIRRSTLALPTPWPSTPESPVNPAIVLGGVILGAGFLAIRRR